MNNELLLLSKNDIPFQEAQVNIHQPSISEISLISEESFWSGCQFLVFSKDIIKDLGEKDLENIPDFEIFMSIMCNSQIEEYKNNTKLVLTLLFPNYEIQFTPSDLLLIGEKGIARINSTNFDIFKNILISMFGLEELRGSVSKYNPCGKRAERIAEKFKKAKQKKEKNKGNQKNKVALLSRYISILAVGEHKDINQLMQYTVFQLKDEFQRYQKKIIFDNYLQAKLAGAKDIEDVDNWMDDIHP